MIWLVWQDTTGVIDTSYNYLSKYVHKYIFNSKKAGVIILFKLNSGVHQETCTYSHVLTVVEP